MNVRGYELGYTLKCIAPLFPMYTLTLHTSQC